MSVVIKGMQMPKTCCECEWHEYYGSDYDWCHACRMTGSMPIEYSVAELGRANDCPLVELPEHHGRLIDENEVRTVMNWLLTQPQRPTWNDTYNAIQEMNAVIEAEDG